MWCQNSGVFCFQGTRKIFKGWFFSSCIWRAEVNSGVKQLSRC